MALSACSENLISGEKPPSLPLSCSGMRLPKGYLVHLLSLSLSPAFASAILEEVETGAVRPGPILVHDGEPRRKGEEEPFLLQIFAAVFSTARDVNQLACSLFFPP